MNDIKAISNRIEEIENWLKIDHEKNAAQRLELSDYKTMLKSVEIALEAVVGDYILNDFSGYDYDEISARYQKLIDQIEQRAALAVILKENLDNDVGQDVPQNRSYSPFGIFNRGYSPVAVSEVNENQNRDGHPNVLLSVFSKF